MKLLLVFPSWAEEFGDFKHAARKVSTFPPLNLCILGAIAKRVGWQVELIDAHIERLNDQDLLERARRSRPDLIGLTATTPFYPEAVRIAALLKGALGVPMMIGGPHVSFYKEKALDDGWDYVAIGECEMTFGLFLKAFACGERQPVVSGFMMKKQGRVCYQGPAPILADLDEAPAPDRGLLKNELYILGTPRGKKRYTSIQMSRGCPFSCVFCANELHGKQVRFRSVESVIAELKQAVTVYGAQHIYFVDDVLTLNRRYILEVCAALQRHGLKFTFEGSSRANLWDAQLVARLKECGLVRISFGLESADEEIRKIIKKEIPMDSYIQANRINNQLGIETTNSVIIGLPGDTRESIERTVRYLCTQPEIQHVTLSIAIPYPGTEMFHMAERGECGLELVERDFSKFQRYGSAVMAVNGMSPGELIGLQRKALLRIYACWWRWVPMLQRFGLRTIVRTGFKNIFFLLRQGWHDIIKKT